MRAMQVLTGSKEVFGGCWRQPFPAIEIACLITNARSYFKCFYFGYAGMGIQCVWCIWRKTSCGAFVEPVAELRT